MANPLTSWMSRLTGRAPEAGSRRGDDDAPAGGFLRRFRRPLGGASGGGPVGYTWQPPSQSARTEAGRVERRRPPTAYQATPLPPRPIEATNPAGGFSRTPDASVDWSATRKPDPPIAPKRAGAEPSAMGPSLVGQSMGATPMRRVTDTAAPHATPAPVADKPTPATGGSAFDRSALPAPLARVTDRLGRMTDQTAGWSNVFTRAVDRITGMGQGEPPPRPAADAGQGAKQAAPAPMRGLGWKGPPVGSEWTDAELIQDVKEASKRETSRLARNLLRMIMLALIVFLIWAAIFRIDEVTRGEGKVVASSQTQIIANLEGGIVNQVLVREGQVVEKGQPLMRLNNLQAVAQLADNRAKYLSLLAQVARLTAEINGTPVNFPAEVAAEAPEVVRAESALMTARLTQFETQMQILRDQRTQRAQEVADLKNKAVKLDQQVKLSREQLAILEPLAAEGLAPRVDVIRSQRDRTQSETELDSARLQIPRAEAALREAERKIDERLQTFKADAQKELNERKTQLEGIAEMQRADRDRVQRTEIASPMRGNVKQILVKTVGGVVKPGQDLIEIVPIEDTLIAEIRISPADVGFVHPGQKASVKVTAFDYSIYGSLDAVVEDVSADSIIDPQDREQKPYFRVRLRTQKMAFGTGKDAKAIQPGMTVSADILTGDRTVLVYLLKPFFKTLSSAFGER